MDALNDLLAGLNTTVADGVTEWENLETELYHANGALEQMAKVKLDNLEEIWLYYSLRFKIPASDL